MRWGSTCRTRPRPEELFKPGSQNYAVYVRLLQGPVTNGELIYRMHIGKYTGRISDVRGALRPYLVDITAEHDGGRRKWTYRLEG